MYHRLPKWYYTPIYKWWSKGYGGRPNKTTGIKYIHKTGQRYVITKTINNHTKYFYSSKSLENCKTVLRYLLANDWKMPPYLPSSSYKKRNYSRYTGIRYVQMLPTGKYILQRQGVHYGTYNTVIDAVKDKLFWESIDWDLDKMDLH